MRSIVIAVALSLAAVSSHGRVWFDPPNPTSLTPVTAHVVGAWGGCGPRDAQVASNEVGVGIVLIFDCPKSEPAVPFDYAVNIGTRPAGDYGVAARYPDLDFVHATLIVRDASPQLQIVPETGTPLELVTIQGAICPIAPCSPPKVFFGDREATALRMLANDVVVAEAPIHANGPVPVTLQAQGRTLQVIEGFYYADPLMRNLDPAFFEPVLLPVAINGAGAFGSQWTTELTARNDNDFPFTTLTIFDYPCMPACDSRLHAHTTRLLRDRNVPSGYLFYVSRQGAPKDSFDILIRDLSRQAEALGTEVPVVREKDFFDRPFTILNVPTDARYRVALRLYRIDGETALRLRIRTLDALEGYGPVAEEPPLVDQIVPLTAANLTLTSAYIGDLLTSFPQLAGRGPLRIEIDGTSKQRTSWAFVSVTNNTTQHVTVIAPH